MKSKLASPRRAPRSCEPRPKGDMPTRSAGGRGGRRPRCCPATSFSRRASSRTSRRARCVRRGARRADWPVARLFGCDDPRHQRELVVRRPQDRQRRISLATACPRVERVELAGLASYATPDRLVVVERDVLRRRAASLEPRLRERVVASLVGKASAGAMLVKALADRGDERVEGPLLVSRGEEDCHPARARRRTPSRGRVPRGLLLRAPPALPADFRSGAESGAARNANVSSDAAPGLPRGIERSGGPSPAYRRGGAIGGSWGWRERSLRFRSRWLHDSCAILARASSRRSANRFRGGRFPRAANAACVGADVCRAPRTRRGAGGGTRGGRAHARWRGPPPLGHAEPHASFRRLGARKSSSSKRCLPSSTPLGPMPLHAFRACILESVWT